MNAYSAALLSGFLYAYFRGDSHMLNLDLIRSVLLEPLLLSFLCRFASARSDEIQVLFYYPYEEIMEIVTIKKHAVFEQRSIEYPSRELLRNCMGKPPGSTYKLYTI
jgi:hypothetical protein